MEEILKKLRERYEDKKLYIKEDKENLYIMEECKCCYHEYKVVGFNKKTEKYSLSNSLEYPNYEMSEHYEMLDYDNEDKVGILSFLDLKVEPEDLFTFTAQNGYTLILDDIMFDKNLNFLDRVVYSKLAQIVRITESEYISISNEKMANALNVTTRTISRVMKTLSEQNYITTDIKRINENGKIKTIRKIYVNAWGDKL